MPKAPILALDCEHCKITGLFTLYTKTGQSFAFDDKQALQAFCALYYQNPMAACYAYHLQENQAMRTDIPCTKDSHTPALKNARHTPAPESLILKPIPPDILIIDDYCNYLDWGIWPRNPEDL